MEISRTLKPVTPAVVDTSAKARPVTAGADSQTQPSRPAASGSLPLEQMQAALRALPDLDLDKVTAIKAALARGEISTDAATLAGHVLAHHRGSDA